MKNEARACGWPIYPADEKSQSQKDSSPKVDCKVFPGKCGMEHGM